jgi:hypothetical protein
MRYVELLPEQFLTAVYLITKVKRGCEMQVRIIAKLKKMILKQKQVEVNHFPYLMEKSKALRLTGCNIENFCIIACS